MSRAKSFSRQSPSAEQERQPSSSRENASLETGLTSEYEPQLLLNETSKAFLLNPNMTGLANQPVRAQAVKALQGSIGNQAVQRFLAQRQGLPASFRMGEVLTAEVNKERSSGGALPEDVQQKMENQLGIELSQVRVHTSSIADQVSREIGAEAFTTGQDIFFRENAYSPYSREGQKILTHELAHVKQQAGSPTGLASENLTVNPPGDVFEQAADRQAERASQSTPVLEGNKVQRQVEEDELQQALSTGESSGAGFAPESPVGGLLSEGAQIAGEAASAGGEVGSLFGPLLPTPFSNPLEGVELPASLQQAGQGLSTAGGQLLGGVGGAASSMFDAAQGAGSSLEGGLFGGLRAGLGGIGNAGSSLFNGVGGAGSSLFGGVEGALNNAESGDFLGALSSLGSGGLGAISSLGGGVSGAVSAAQQGARGAAGSVLGGLLGAGSQALTGASGAASSLWGGVSGAASTLYDTGSGIVSGITGVGSDAGKWLADLF